MSLAHDYMPAVRYGAKWLPQEILGGGLGLPYIGNIFWVDPAAGSDSYSGTAPDQAKATVAAAYALTTSGNHDVVIINPSVSSTSTTGRTTETEAITWSNKFTHLIGNAASVIQDNRAGMNFAGTTGTASSSITISGTGCIFANLTLTASDDANEFVTITGDYNGFYNVDFKGSFNATAVQDASWRALVLSGAQENYFSQCTFGGDTATRSAASATVEFESASSRNVFEDCRFLMATSATTPVHVLFTGTSAIDRWIEFRDSTFYNFTANNATEPAAVMDLSAQTATGHVLLTGAPTLVNIDNWEATASGRIYFNSYSATANAVGKPINPTVD